VHVVERALAEGYRAARVTCEAMAALAFLNWPGYTDVERELDSVCRARPLSVLCQYQQAATKDARLREITGIHLGGIRQRLLVTGPAPAAAWPWPARSI
jgi:MEDS: MEthanogen/methylotroph, DcmR Sensory domain